MFVALVVVCGIGGVPVEQSCGAIARTQLYPTEELCMGHQLRLLNDVGPLYDNIPDYISDMKCVEVKAELRQEGEGS